MIVIMCDGSSKGNPGPASIGVVAWNRINNPRIVYPDYRFSHSIGIKTNMEAEWHALLESMKYAYATGPTQEIHIFCDSQTVVKQANGEWKVKHAHIQKLYADFCELKNWLTNLHITWVPRQLVYLADKAAQKGVK